MKSKKEKTFPFSEIDPYHFFPEKKALTTAQCTKTLFSLEKGSNFLCLFYMKKKTMAISLLTFPQQQLKQKRFANLLFSFSLGTINLHFLPLCLFEYYSTFVHRNRITTTTRTANNNNNNHK